MVGQFRHTILYELENIIEEYDLDLEQVYIMPHNIINIDLEQVGLEIAGERHFVQAFRDPCHLFSDVIFDKILKFIYFYRDIDDDLENATIH